MEYRLGELFCGAGGLAYGALTAVSIDGSRISHQWATDIDTNACETYRRNICPQRPESVVCHDVRELDLNVLREIGDIDALAFGFPCNDYSTVGERKGLHGKYGPLYRYGVLALQFFRPMWFIAENVDGLRSANNGGALQQILTDFRSAGYTLAPHLYKFEEYGVPQARHRYVIVGIRNDIPCRYTVPDTAPYRARTCQDALENPPIPDDAPNHEKSTVSPVVAERLSYIQEGENAFTAKLPERLRLNVKGAKISQIYKRLDHTKPAYTVTASGGGGTHMYHWNENRALTNRERARLQTFPDTYVFHGKRGQVRRQIGMAVPCDGARIICEAVMNAFDRMLAQ